MNELPTADIVQREMRAIRGCLDADVGQLVEDARRLVDWRRHLKKYPWLALGAAVAIGFLIIPRRPKPVNLDADALAELARRDRLVLHVDGKTSNKNGGVTGALLTLATAAATRGASAWANRQMGTLTDNWAARVRRQPESTVHGR